MYDFIHRKDMVNLKDTKQLNKILRRVNGEIGALYHEAAMEVGISDSVQNIFYVLGNNGNCCLQSDFYKQTNISRQTINSAIHKLEKDGIVTIEQGTGKNTIISLTEKGLKFAEEKVYVLFDIEDSLFDEWTEEEREMYVRLTQKFRDSLKRAIETKF